jgi:hypothetical protein
MNAVRNIRINTRLMSAIGIIFLFVAIVTIGIVNWKMKQHALKEAESKAGIMLDRNLAIHTYFTHQLKPVLFDMIKKNGAFDTETYFEPVWMSSTYAIREMEKYFQSLTDMAYYYKECAINARSPENEADAYERSFIQKLNQSPALDMNSSVRIIKDQPFFAVLRRGETMEASCLKCHSTPDMAPEDLVSLYGSERSFNRSLDEAITAISIRIPLGEAYASVNQLIFRLSVLFAIVFIGLFAIVAFLNGRLVFIPLKKIRHKAMQISTDPKHLGEQIDLPEGKELAELVIAFNEMSIQLFEDRTHLETRIDERTHELKKTNEKLQHEIIERKQTIGELKQTLNEVKILRGILPICSYCKKIRDDQGYWNQLELYLMEHSRAELSHSLCPECAGKYYPDIKLYDE